MKTLSRFFLLGLFVLALSLSTQRAACQGSTTPPSAPSVPIMKTLDQVEPRIPIPAGGSYTISSPGSYYLTGSITSTTIAAAITINASQVTLDLSGYTVTSTNTFGTGISLSSSGVNMVEIKNGKIHGGSVGLEAAGNAGVSHSIRIHDLMVSDTSLGGIAIDSSFPGTVVSDCVVSNIGSTNGTIQTFGISGSADTTVERCVVDKVSANNAVMSIGIRVVTGALVANNRVSNCQIGVSNGKAQNNLTYKCDTPFDTITDAGGNN